MTARSFSDPVRGCQAGGCQIFVRIPGGRCGAGGGESSGAGTPRSVGGRRGIGAGAPRGGRLPRGDLRRASASFGRTFEDCSPGSRGKVRGVRGILAGERVRGLRGPRSGQGTTLRHYRSVVPDGGSLPNSRYRPTPAKAALAVAISYEPRSAENRNEPDPAKTTISPAHNAARLGLFIRGALSQKLENAAIPRVGDPVLLARLARRPALSHLD